MGKFRKLPVDIDAWKVAWLLGKVKEHPDDIPRAIYEGYLCGDLVFFSDHILINTLEGQHRANIDDWLIQGVKGEFYPCKPDIFTMTYKVVEKGERDER